MAHRDKVPLLVGLMGCSGSGKTYSALRLATGIQRVTGGEIFVIDTESKRSLHYADNFKFKHVEFVAPFGSEDYLEALRFCAKAGAGVIVVDSMSHEHEGEGGYLSAHGAEVTRMAGNDYAKAERVKMAAWIKPAAARRKLINGILQLNANFIFCFRAKEKTKPKPGGGIQEMGWMPIAGDEFLFEMTLNALLMPNGKGVPQWRSDFVGEKMMMKLPKQFEAGFEDGRALDENHGESLARWAQGTVAAKITAPTPPASAAPRKTKTAADWYHEAAETVMRFETATGLNEWRKANAARLEMLEKADKNLAEQLQGIIAEQAADLGQHVVTI